MIRHPIKLTANVPIGKLDLERPETCVPIPYLTKVPNPPPRKIHIMVENDIIKVFSFFLSRRGCVQQIRNLHAPETP